MTTPELRSGIVIALRRMRSMILWRMGREEISYRIVVRVKDMIEEADRLAARDLHEEAVAKMTNAAIYLGQYMYVS